jgi:D-alanyl-D-alanine carboxypeptidase/D-alanyl-D-alanine-endopeptidase (penicillin-binding protein 4)
MRVEVVAAPVRYPRTPLLALFLVALVPAVGLIGLLLWSDTRADEYESVESGSPAPAAPTGVDPGPPTPALTTSLMSYRRAPSVVASVANTNALADEVDPVYGYLDERSCSSVSVNGRHVTGINETTSVIPASNQKLLVAAVALEVLGPEFTFTTRLTGPAPVEGVIDGDVVIVGGGDPLLTSSDYPIANDSDPAINVTTFDQLADQLVAAGVTRINGSVLGDGSRYDDEYEVDSWGEGVAGVEAGPYDALMVNDSRTLGRSGKQPDPNAAAAREFVRLLGERGITVSGGWDAGVADPAAAELASIQSAPLDAVVAEMLTTSDDNTAELMLKELGVADSAIGTRTAGVSALSRTLASWGVPMDGVRAVDGSGLSLDNRVTCAAILAVLQRAAGSPLQAGLPIAGQTGTLAQEFVGTPVAGRLVAKTGTLGNEPVISDPPSVKALSGYLPVANGDVIEFTMILNSPDIALDGRYQPLWVALAERLDTYPAGPDLAELSPR